MVQTSKIKRVYSCFKEPHRKGATEEKGTITAHIFSNFFRESLIVSLWIIHMKSVVEELLQERYRKRTRISYNHINSVEPANHSMESVQMPDHMS